MLAPSQVKRQLPQLQRDLFALVLSLFVEIEALQDKFCSKVGRVIRSIALELSDALWLLKDDHTSTAVQRLPPYVNALGSLLFNQH